MKPSSHKEYNIKLCQIPTKELMIYKEFLDLDPIKFKQEIEDIEQELLIRELDFCKPVLDLICC
jgi:hypothetical protein